MTDNSKFWRELDPSTQNYCLEKDIQKAEKKMKEANELREENLERIFDAENLRRLKGMNIKDFSWQDVEILNEIKKRHVNVGKTFDGSALSDIPRPEGYEPDNRDTLKQMMEALNTIKQSLEGRGYQVPQLKPINSLSDVLQNFLSVRDSLKGQIQQPEVEEEYDEPIKWNREELLTTKSEIEKMLRKLDGR